MPQQIIKRNGKRERFEAYKIQQAIEKAFHASQEEYNPLVYTSVLDAIKGEEYLPVEKVQDLIESELMKAGAFETARNFIKYRFLHKLQREQIARRPSRSTSAILTGVSRPIPTRLIPTPGS